jgi:hypothetical protein
MPKCPEILTVPLPTFLPRAGEQLQPIMGHDTLASVLGLTLAHLRAMHPTTSSLPDENARASAHLLKLFIQDPVVQSLLPTDPPASQPASEELPTLPALQAHLASVENAVANLVANAAASAAKERPRPATSIRLQLTNVPTTRFGSSIQYMMQELYKALKAENIYYAELNIICGPYWDYRHVASWVKDTATLTFVFRDYPDFSIAENLLRQEWLYAFGYGCGVMGMDGRGWYPPPGGC